MNTPAHVIASCVLLPHRAGWLPTAAVVTGAILPDLPMFLFYAYQKVMGRGERDIWGTLYFDPAWQNFFDWFNSIPLAAVLLALCWWRGWEIGTLLFASILLHCLCDLPLHHDDSHRHFFPLTDWRFASPVSYWDPAHHGRVMMALELLGAIAGSVWLVWQAKPAAMRWVGGVTLGLYAMVIAAALAFFLRRSG